MLSKEAFKEFQDIYYREFGIRLSMTEATEKAADLIQLFRSVLSEKEDGCANEKKDKSDL